MSVADLMRAGSGRLDRFGMAGLLLLLASAIAYAALVPQRLATQAALLASPASARSGGASAAPDSAEVESRLQAFRHRLPASASVPQWLGRIRQAALQSGLVLHSADYKLERVPDSPVLRYRITLPISGSYTQVRTFVGSVLSEVPAVAIDDVQLKRDGVSPRSLDVRIRLTLFIAAE